MLHSVQPFTRRSAKDAILGCLTQLTRYKGRAGEIAVGRAAIELAGGIRAGYEHSGVKWDHWIPRWNKFTRDERKNHARNEILPLLMRQPKPSAVDTPPPSRAPPRQFEICKTEPEEGWLRDLRELEDNLLGPDLAQAIATRAGIKTWPRGP